MDFQQAFTQVAHSNYVLAIIVLIAVDFVTGVLSALHRGVFSWQHVGDLIPGNVLGGLVTLVAQVVGHVMAGTAGNIVDPAVFSIFALASVASSLENLQELTGLPLAKYADYITNWLLGWLRSKNAPAPVPPTPAPAPVPLPDPAPMPPIPTVITVTVAPPAPPTPAPVAAPVPVPVPAPSALVTPPAPSPTSPLVSNKQRVDAIIADLNALKL